MEFKILSSNPVFRGRVFDVDVDTIQYPTGNQSVREVVRHPGGACAVALPDDDHILLVEQLRYPFQQRLLELPAGRLEPDEDPMQTALRELQEEAGMHAGTIELLTSIYPTPGFCSEIIHIYLARNLTPVPPHLTPEEGELHLVARTLKLDEALDHIQRGTIRDAKTIIGIFLTLQKLGRN